MAREFFVEANGISHHVLEWGEGPETVVLCHGFLDMAYGFVELAPLLAARGYRVLAADFRGHGESGWIGSGGYYYFPDYVLDLHRLLPQLVDTRFHLVGHSMGGTVGALYAASHPERLKSLSLVEGFGPPAEPARDAPARMSKWLKDMDAPRDRALFSDLAAAEARLQARHPTLGATLLRALAERSTCPHPSGTGITWRFDPLHRTRSPIGFDADRFEACLLQIEAPTLLVQAERGLRVADEGQRFLQLRYCQRVEIPGAGHMIHWTHAPSVSELLLGHFAVNAG